MSELEELLIRWRRAKAHFGDLAIRDPDVFNKETQSADDEVIDSTGDLFEWMDEHLPQWKEKKNV